MPNIMNSRDMRFVITPNMRSDFHKELEKSLEEYKTVQQHYKNLPESKKEQHSHILTSFKNRLSKAAERAKKETESNQELIHSSYGKEVSYGMDLQLMHFDSGMFVSAKNECSETESIGYKLELSNFYQRSMIFQFVPRFKSRNIGDKVQFGDFLYIKNIETNNLLCVSDTQFEVGVDLSQDEINPFL